MNAKELKEKFKVVCRKCRTDKHIEIEDEESESYRNDTFFNYMSCKCKKCGNKVSLY